MKVVPLLSMTVWLGLVLVFPVTEYAQHKKALIYFCKLPVAPEVNESNLSFTETYRIQLSETNELKTFLSSENRFTNADDVRGCVREWKLTGFSDRSLFVLTFKWEHGVGWTEMRISTKGFLQTISQRLSD